MPPSGNEKMLNAERAPSVAWFGKYRLLSKDYDYLTASSEAMIFVVMLHLMICRIEAKQFFDSL
jgi:hypothetical protein